MDTSEERKAARKKFYEEMNEPERMAFDTKRMLKSMVVDISSLDGWEQNKRISRSIESAMYLLRTYYPD